MAERRWLRAFILCCQPSLTTNEDQKPIKFTTSERRSPTEPGALSTPGCLSCHEACPRARTRQRQRPYFIAPPRKNSRAREIDAGRASRTRLSVTTVGVGSCTPNRRLRERQCQGRPKWSGAPLDPSRWGMHVGVGMDRGTKGGQRMTVTGRERKQGPFRAGRLYPRPSGVAGGDGRAHRQLRRQGSANCITIIASMYWRAADPSSLRHGLPFAGKYVGPRRSGALEFGDRGRSVAAAARLGGRTVLIRVGRGSGVPERTIWARETARAVPAGPPSSSMALRSLILLSHANQTRV